MTAAYVSRDDFANQSVGWYCRWMSEDAVPAKLLVALVSAVGGQEDEFNAWYVEHMREVAEIPGIRPGVRYRLSDVQAAGAAPAENEYLALYEIDGEIPEVLEEIVSRRASGEWTPRRAIDDATIKMWAFERITNDGKPA
jgi:hypothetical protein